MSKKQTKSASGGASGSEAFSAQRSARNARPTCPTCGQKMPRSFTPLGIVLSRKLDELNLTTTEFAARTGRTRMSVTQWMRRPGGMHSDSLIAIAGALGTSVDELLALVNAVSTQPQNTKL